MIVAGGYYVEQCVSPEVNSAFGSGGRAALAIAASGSAVEWHYYCPPEFKNDIAIRLAYGGLSHFPFDSSDLISFRYFHPLSKPVYSPGHLRQHEPIEVSGASILRFGFMEGDAIVHGKKVVYDPQAPGQPTHFRTNGSTADQLAVVLNAMEVHILGGSENEESAVNSITEHDDADIVLVKAGVEGCRIYSEGRLIGTAPPYRSRRVYRIGTGDIFSAAFSHHWITEDKSAVEAADAASRCVARYCAYRYPSVVLDNDTKSAVPIEIGERGPIYLAGPFFTTGELWLVEEAWRALVDLGAEVFSPYHDVGAGPAAKVVEPDLAALKESKVVFAVLDGCDPGTLFEVGFAVNRGIPVVALSQNPRNSDLTMLLGSACCEIFDDFATAIYHAAWESWR